MDARRGRAADGKLQALLLFTHQLLETKGAVNDSTLDRVRTFGYTDAKIAEVATIVALMTLGGYFNNLDNDDLLKVLDV